MKALICDHQFVVASGWCGDEVGGYDCPGSARLPCAGMVSQADLPRTACVAEQVRKILRSDETSFSYERERQPKPKIGPWQDQLDGFLNGNRGKTAREQLTQIRIYEELCSLGYEGGYDAVRRYAKNWAKAQGSAMADAYVPLFFAPGEAYQFDWSHEIVLINGVTVTEKVAHVRLCQSRMMFVGTVRNFVCGRAVEHYAAMARMKRSPKMTANWALAIVHSRGGIFHSFSDRFKIR